MVHLGRGVYSNFHGLCALSMKKKFVAADGVNLGWISLLRCMYQLFELNRQRN